MTKENKTKTTYPPVVFKVNGVEGLNMKWIDVYIDYDSTVGVCFSYITTYFAVDMFTRSRKNAKDASSVFPRCQRGAVSMESIYMYIYIGHESSLGVCFSNIPTPCSRWRFRVGRAPLWLRSPPFHARWQVGHGLVLVFATTHRHLALRAPSKLAAMMLFFLRNSSS